MLGALGEPVSAAAPMLTRGQSDQLHEANADKGGPSFIDWESKDFALWCKANKSPGTIDTRKSTIRTHFSAEPIAHKPGGTITDYEYQDMILSLPLKQPGRRKLNALWRKFFDHLIDLGVRRNNPAKDFKVPRDKTVEDVIKYYSWDDFQVLRANAEGRLAAYLDVGYGTGARPDELTLLRYEDFDLVEGSVTIRRGRYGPVKGGKPATIPLLPIARRGLEILADGGGIPDEGWLFPNSRGDAHSRQWRCGLKEHCAELGVEYKGSYGLRHGYCFALANGVFGEQWSREEARPMMRHVDANTIDVYYRLRPGRLHEKARLAVLPAINKAVGIIRTRVRKHSQND
jgi:integrase